MFGKRFETGERHIGTHSTLPPLTRKLSFSFKHRLA